MGRLFIDEHLRGDRVAVALVVALNKDVYKRERQIFYYE